MPGLVELLGTLKDKDEVIFCVPVLFSTFYKSKSFFPRFSYDRCFGNPVVPRFAKPALNPVT